MTVIGDSRLPTRFWDKVTVSQTGCWEWTASTRAGGYGYFYWQGRDDLAHRVAYAVLVATVPGKLSLDHLCRVRHCVNPDHLEPVTHRTNVLRGEAPTAQKARATECPNGHPYPDAQAPGNRRCVPCGQDQLSRKRERYATDPAYRARAIERSRNRYRHLRAANPART
ncbi:HNH endonuclease [Plantactinospora solaniradicis]|uniref:HNH endonuclease n=1 Tax=Plantactinospora solaniradicis TaxID=1723736 RepID=A0ABW1K8B6_9ACTN